MNDVPPERRPGGRVPDRIRKRRVFTTATMTDEDAARIAASMPTADEIRTGRYAWQSNVPLLHNEGE